MSFSKYFIGDLVFIYFFRSSLVLMTLNVKNTFCVEILKLKWLVVNIKINLCECGHYGLHYEFSFHLLVYHLVEIYFRLSQSPYFGT